MKEAFRCGTIAIVGRPNVGKSTLLNTLVGQKLAITSRKPQTTRHRLLGILTTGDTQYIFVDTPGFQTEHGGTLNRMLNRNVQRSLQDVDVVMWVVEAGVLGPADYKVAALLPDKMPLVLVVNKIDRVSEAELLPFLQRCGSEFERAEIVPVSAEQGRNKDELLAVLRKLLPEQPAIYPEDELTDRNERFLAAEFIREKLFRLLGDEVPYGSAVVIDQFKDEGNLRRIYASIIVEKPGQKAIVIGKGGAKLKEIATAARLDMEKLFGCKVYLEVWVKVRSGWSENENLLRSFGYDAG
ncbi:MAG: GTPase Era [Pseudomonadota bacterium]|mgnify:FL=1|uniref:GTPase Era n=1 Tax=Caldimonas thermodepolymerans TaxID=215580 RepID=UPI000DB593BF|nr:GTPase Era [Caldimonas thermodepolymerans]PZN04512.1 MAG: GTPase Era [Pseudomonadota bacterium]